MCVGTRKAAPGRAVDTTGASLQKASHSCITQLYHVLNGCSRIGGTPCAEPICMLSLTNAVRIECSRMEACLVA
jgi:hypothetical protein